MTNEIVQQTEWPFGTTPEEVIREQWESLIVTSPSNLQSHMAVWLQGARSADDLITVLDALTVAAAEDDGTDDIIFNGGHPAFRLRIEILAALGIKEG